LGRELTQQQKVFNKKEVINLTAFFWLKIKKKQKYLSLKKKVIMSQNTHN